MKENIEYLENRARLFFRFLELKNIDKIFPYRSESLKELNKIIDSKNYRKIYNFNKLLNNLIIGNNGFLREQKIELLEYLSTKLKQEENLILEKKNLYEKIMNKGIIKSRVEINEAIEILNSDLLELSDSEKIVLKKIIADSMLIRI